MTGVCGVAGDGGGVLFPWRFACYEQPLMRWLRNSQREDGLEGFLAFAASALKSESLKHKIGTLTGAGWRPYHEGAQVTCEYDETPWDL